jgi:peptide/nickel transport system substrate-binding protein
VLENVDASTQKVNIQAGTAQMAVSLGPDQVKDLDTGKTKVLRGESTNTIFMWFNQDPQYGKSSAGTKFVQAMRHAIDYQALLGIAGSGSVQPGGLVPTSFLGSLASDPSNTHDVAKAKALLAESGYKGEPVSILYSNDVAIGGVKMQDVAETIQAQVKPLGVNLKLNPQPSATSLDSFRSGKAQAGVAYWGADYPDPADYLTFAPGQGLAQRAAWTAAQAPASAKLAEAAASASGDTARAVAYQKLQKQMNVDGPFIPLFLPAHTLVYSSTLNGVYLNPIWNLDFGAIT